MTVELEPIEGVTVSGTYHREQRQTRVDPPLPDYVDDFKAVVGDVDITELLDEDHWLEKLAEKAREDIVAAYERQHEPD